MYLGTEYYYSFGVHCSSFFGKKKKLVCNIVS